MLRDRSEIVQPRIAKAIGFAIGALVLVWTLSNWILSGSLINLLLVAILSAGIAFMIALLKDWRYGIYSFLVWLVFEDLIRKFSGNGLALFFTKDVLICMTYVAMFRAYRLRQLLTFKPPFMMWLMVFFWFGVLQALNPNSPSMIYGMLGLKTYFLYAPMMFAGYALLRTEEDLYRVLMVNMWIALVVAGLGVAQSVLGLNFLNPTDLDVNLQDLGRDVRVSPLTHMRVERGTSVYVSEGRFAQSLILFFILAVGAAGYVLMRTKRGRNLVFPTLGVVVLATVMAGIRSSFVAVIVSAIVLPVGIFWGSPPLQKRELFRVGKAIRWAFAFAAVAIVLMILLFPDVIRARWALYSETLSPGSTASELGNRSWDYPIHAIETVVKQPNWQVGNGIGTASLGVQYVSRLTHKPVLQLGAESGYATLLAEMGVAGVILWEIWTLSLLASAWRIVRKLKFTRMFPIGFAIFWFATYILVFGTFYGMTTYQNYLTNAYFWLLVGVLFRLPGLLAQEENQAAAGRAAPIYAVGT